MTLRLSCPNAKRYKGVRPPKCGCVECRLKWLEAEVERAKNTVIYHEPSPVVWDGFPYF